MNQIQEAIARVTGLADVMEEHQGQIGELRQAYEHVNGENALLVRQIEDLDYLNLFDLHSIVEVIPIADRKKHYNKLRRLRQENPLAKQSVKLITRFTLGNGVQVSIGPDPEKAQPSAADVSIDDADPEGAPKLNGLFPGPRVNSSRQNAGLKPLSRARPQVSEAVELDDDDQLKEQIEEFWSDPDNQKCFTSHEAMKEWLDSVITDGEKFFVGFTSQVAPYIRLSEIPVEEITDIIYDPQNRKIPVYYRRDYLEMEFSHKDGYRPKGKGEPKTMYYLDHELSDEQIERAKESIHIESQYLAKDDQRVFHTMINPLWTKKGKRGVSDLYASREWFRVYKEFMEDRAAINAAATAVAYKRKIKAGPTGVAQFEGKFGGVDVGYDNPNNNNEIRRLTKPMAGSVHTSNPAVDLEWMKTDTGAVNAEKDARSIMAVGGAGVGIFVHYYGEGGDANLATAQAMELPMVKTFEDWQEWTNSAIRAMLKWLITVATDAENAKEQIKRVSGTFPPLISQDVVKFTTAWSQVVQNIAPGNKVMREEAIRGALGVMRVPNIDALMARVQAEEVQVELDRQQREADMKAAMAENAAMLNGNGSGNGKPPPGAPRNGNDQGLPPDLATVAKGRPAPERNGPKPAR